MVKNIIRVLCLRRGLPVEQAFFLVKSFQHGGKWIKQGIEQGGIGQIGRQMHLK